MAKKTKFDTSFNFGDNVARKAKAKGSGKRKLSSAQKYTAAMYMQPRRR